MKVLVTGFDPFGGATINPAYEAVKLLPDQIAGAEIIKVEIPTVFGKGPAAVCAAIAEYQPDFVLSIGQAGGRAFMNVERVGINLRDARIPDNDKRQPMDEPIVQDGPAAYFTTLPAKAMVKKMKEHGIPAAISYTAGTYVCNDVMYSVLHELATKYPGVKGGFIHVPYDIQQVVDMAATMPSMPIATISDAIRYGIEAMIENPEDIAEVGGITH